ncbi:Cytochrome 76A2 [Capsicum chinense]|nr:Cytochrome 76A2 [Capsicum chinense]
MLLPAFILFLSKKKTTKCSYKLPPGPPGLPIFGNMFQLGNEPYKKMACLKQQYGPVLWFKVGPSINIMVVQTVPVAAELFKNHDISFADRPIIDVDSAHNYYQGSLTLNRYGSLWRFQRRICTVEMFGHKKIIETVPVRRKCVDNMLKWIEKAANSDEKGSGIEVTRFVFLTSFNMLGNLIMSKDLADPDSKEASEFFNAMKGIMEWSGTANVSDIFPFLRRFDLQKLRKKMVRDMGKAMEIASIFLKEREGERKKGEEERKDLLDVLIEVEDTTSTTVEWALTELLRHPEAMDKVKTEISKVVGPNRKFEESDIDNLPYMQVVIKESLRLHPPVPLLLPRETIHDTKFMGYDVPKGTQVLVNVWATGRDPECWDEPLSFKPERPSNDAFHSGIVASRIRMGAS